MDSNRFKLVARTMRFVVGRDALANCNPSVVRRCMSAKFAEAKFQVQSKLKDQMQAADAIGGFRGRSKQKTSHLSRLLIEEACLRSFPTFVS